MNSVEKYNETIFESIKRVDEYGNEFWSARDLQKALEYKKWENFHKVIKEAMITCENSGYLVSDCFPDVRKSIISGKGRISYIKDYNLNRYACYLIVQNGDSRKQCIALGKTYFAIQTRKQEITMAEYESLSDNDKRLYQRNLIKQGNYTLQKVAANAGVKNMAEFHNAGYRGLYNGETADDIFRRKKLHYREDILDNMCEDEMIANLFRINQTKQKLIRDNIQGEKKSNDTHYEVGKKVRKAIADIGGIMPENMPTPGKSLKALEREKKQLESRKQKNIKDKRMVI